ncbi:phosphatases II [Coniophora puteana RWD-64-598 SS2]|uniref:Phosphatases II n=1 Tax=Coniophora puteana (strain RWD-64-598) TaxID=741705 RepID=A0A5M3N3L1_CONPW|nr:phosphatases II [Coniophora puteana RWD-64-598 SS2]EIW85992.1 phosphatases II [Coniophora puteana RWD-64-598 SS2]
MLTPSKPASCAWAPACAGTRARPIPNSYWATPLLVACEYPWSPHPPPRYQFAKLDALLRAGVTTFVDLTESGELAPYLPHLGPRARALGLDPGALAYHRFPIRDRSLPCSADLMKQIMHLLRVEGEQGRICAVHCRGGIGRTGTVVGCWLVECGEARNGEEALARIANEWRYVEKCKRYPQSPETGPQFEYVRSFRTPSPVPVKEVI